MNDIPVIHVKGKTIADGYEKAIYETYKNGYNIKTQYDKPDDPPSKDCTLNLVVENPAGDPMIHKCFPGGIADLREYVYELHGYKDEWVKNINDPEDTRWEYTYHGRLAKYGSWKEKKKCLLYDHSMLACAENSEFYENEVSSWDNSGINQIEWVVNKLVDQPYTRQAQMITWMPKLDLGCYDPPCLQSIWLRITENKDGDKWLNTNIRFRSNDGWGASFMNMFGLMRLVRTIADKIEEKIDDTILIGRLNWQADSYHIYGKDIKACKEMLIDKIEAGQPFEKRIWNFHDETIQEMYHECENSILEKIKKTEDGFKK